MIRPRALWVSIRSSLWFVPVVMVVSAMLAAIGLVEVDKHFRMDWSDDYPLLFGAGAEGSRGMLSTIAGSMITVAGITFSLTIAALATASAQYTSRVLRNFMRDGRNQFVLGAFLGIFAYCLVVLRTIRSDVEASFVPSLAVFAGLLLALLGIAVLVFFIHHIATSIQAATIIEAITAETIAALQRGLPAQRDDAFAADRSDVPPSWSEEPAAQVIHARSRGYVQVIDSKRLLDIATRADIRIRVEVPPGGFVMHGTPLLSVFCIATVEDATRADLGNAVAIHSFRTIDQEFGFGIRQLVDIALKAISPGINDTTTAVMCVDHLGAILAMLAQRSLPGSLAADDGQVRLMLQGASFPSLLATAFDEVRREAGRNVAVVVRLLDALTAIAAHTRDPARTAALLEHAWLVRDVADRSLDVPHDRQIALAALLRLQAALACSHLEIALTPARG